MVTIGYHHIACSISNRQNQWSAVYCSAVTIDTGYAIYMRYFSPVEARVAYVAHFAGFLGGELLLMLLDCDLSFYHLICCAISCSSSVVIHNLHLFLCTGFQ